MGYIQAYNSHNNNRAAGIYLQCIMTIAFGLIIFQNTIIPWLFVFGKTFELNMVSRPFYHLDQACDGMYHTSINQFFRWFL